MFFRRSTLKREAFGTSGGSGEVLEGKEGEGKGQEEEEGWEDLGHLG